VTAARFRTTQPSSVYSSSKRPSPASPYGYFAILPAKYRSTEGFVYLIVYLLELDKLLWITTSTFRCRWITSWVMEIGRVTNVLCRMDHGRDSFSSLWAAQPNLNIRIFEQEKLKKVCSFPWFTRWLPCGDGGDGGESPPFTKKEQHLNTDSTYIQCFVCLCFCSCSYSLTSLPPSVTLGNILETPVSCLIIKCVCASVGACVRR
jgi:hypothetical protein